MLSGFSNHVDGERFVKDDVICVHEKFNVLLHSS